MQGSAIAPPHQVPQIRWMIAAMILGAAGSMIAIAAFGSGTYSVGALVVKMQVRPATTGTTELGIETVALRGGFASADTHMGFLAVRGSVVGVRGDPSVVDAVRLTGDPATLADYIQQQGKDAARRFLLRIGLITLAGGASGGMVIALVGMKARRVLQGAVAGLILVALLGLVAWQTYDIEKFEDTRFQAPSAAPLLGG